VIKLNYFTSIFSKKIIGQYAVLTMLAMIGSQCVAKPVNKNTTASKKKPIVVAANARRIRFAYPGMEGFIKEMVRKHKFNERKLRIMFSKLKRRPDIVRTMNRPAEGMKWHRYRKIFITPSRINKGVRFWNRNAATLAKAERQYGVPAKIIVAIIGVETFYGERTGTIKILESLSTLAFGYPRRAKYFRRELEQFLLMSKNQGFNPASLRGSYAGAMGLPQFMPSSYRRYARDFNGDGRRDLFGSRKDAIGSVANYFKAHGWKTGQPVATPAKLTGNRYRKLPRPKSRLKPSYSMGQLATYGVRALRPSSRYSSLGKISFIKLTQARGATYWLGFKNFYVITRYNHSELYAMAVFELANKVEKARSRHSRKR